MQEGWRPPVGGEEATTGAACSACGAACALEEVRLAFWTTRGLVALEGGQAWVCQSCGESEHTAPTARRLAYLAMTDFPAHEVIRHVQVPVFSLAAEAPVATPAQDPAAVASGSSDVSEVERP